MDDPSGGGYSTSMLVNGTSRTSSYRAWGIALAWLLFIYGSIPLARAVQEVAQARGVRTGFLWLTVLVLGSAGGWVAWAFRHQRFILTRGRAGWLVALFGVMGWLVWSLRGNPEEAFHFVQYGVLSVLVYRALRRHMADPSIFLLTAIIVATAGVLDELIQWITPRRFFDFRDIGINAIGGAMVMTGLGLGLRPETVRGLWSRCGIRAVLGATSCTLALLLFCVVNTPDFKAWYSRYLPMTERVPGSTAEYGFRIADPELGVFYSRFSREALALVDAARGAEVAELLGRYRSDAGYKLFLERYSPERHPLAYEARIHLYRRDYHAALSRTRNLDVKNAGHHAFIALREDAILSKYFPVMMQHYSYAWSEGFRETIAARAITEPRYTSPVSAHLITISPLLLKTLTGLLLVLSLSAWWRLGWRRAAGAAAICCRFHDRVSSASTTAQQELRPPASRPMGGRGSRRAAKTKWM